MDYPWVKISLEDNVPKVLGRMDTINHCDTDVPIHQLIATLDAKNRRVNLEAVGPGISYLNHTEMERYERYIMVDGDVISFTAYSHFFVLQFDTEEQTDIYTTKSLP